MRPALSRRAVIITGLIFVFASPPSAAAAPVSVRFTEGAVQGFLLLRDSGGQVLASGDWWQIPRKGADRDPSTLCLSGRFALGRDVHVYAGPGVHAAHVPPRPARPELSPRHRGDGRAAVGPLHRAPSAEIQERGHGGRGDAGASRRPLRVGDAGGAPAEPRAGRRLQRPHGRVHAQAPGWSASTPSRPARTASRWAARVASRGATW